MMCEYPALPVVDDNLNVIRIVSESNILEHLREKRLSVNSALNRSWHAVMPNTGPAAHRGHAGRTPR